MKKIFIVLSVMVFVMGSGLTKEVKKTDLQIYQQQLKTLEIKKESIIKQTVDIVKQIDYSIAQTQGVIIYLKSKEKK